ncbi:DUF1259 domain-containing protein [Shouchella clausii]|uniref:DUF1259 domain-containing protein n=1 Tax=Shouchella clausii TaxID=79880 RepID=UPI000B968495|nr:DUF1259 domain-containing protein [Shouchella clausii]AST95739.1 hypothetical protein BC8716_07175 [Shouchella clausii]MCR1288994.1 DUF1259 domain-containing protein [Shouchella clausii]MEB5472145.1 DUF1259 domain-containing protein [Shouchella clausii]QNM42093.1 DUF1259 domain-containing protein [Shouchella clausii]WQG95073.1 DUF1259 domain-containing protein [Shouchella clausii]
MTMFYSACEQAGVILGQKPTHQNGVCSVDIPRSLHATIQGRPTKASLHIGVTFEALDQNGTALNLAEMVLLQEEVPVVVRGLAEQGVIVSAIHNHWLFTDPVLMYVHAQSVEEPASFSQKINNALHYITI